MRTNRESCSYHKGTSDLFLFVPQALAWGYGPVALAGLKIASTIITLVRSSRQARGSHLHDASWSSPLGPEGRRLQFQPSQVVLGSPIKAAAGHL